MIKFYAMLTRRADLTHERFSEHWRTVHRELAVKIRRTRRYAQSHGIEERLAGLRSAAWDGVAEVWLDDLAAASRSDPDLERYAKPDEPNFLAPDGIPQICAEHRVVVPPPEDGVKALVYGDRRAPSPDLERWWEAAASIGDLCDDPAGLAAAVALPEAGPAPHDAVLELWWRDLPALRTDWERNGAAILDRLGDLVDVDRAVGWVGEELRVTWPGPLPGTS